MAHANDPAVLIENDAPLHPRLAKFASQQCECAIETYWSKPSGAQRLNKFNYWVWDLWPSLQVLQVGRDNHSYVARPYLMPNLGLQSPKAHGFWLLDDVK